MKLSSTPYMRILPKGEEEKAPGGVTLFYCKAFWVVSRAAPMGMFRMENEERVKAWCMVSVFSLEMKIM